MMKKDYISKDIKLGYYSSDNDCKFIEYGESYLITITFNIMLLNHVIIRIQTFHFYVTNKFIGI